VLTDGTIGRPATATIALPSTSLWYRKFLSHDWIDLSIFDALGSGNCKVAITCMHPGDRDIHVCAVCKYVYSGFWIFVRRSVQRGFIKLVNVMQKVIYQLDDYKCIDNHWAF